jgi:anti-anti-sigma factor
MKVTRDDVDGIPVLRLVGEFDSFETELVREAFEECVRQGRHSVVLDLDELSFANSTTIAYLITAQKRAQKEGGKVVIARPRDFIQKTLATLGLNQVFTITDTVEAAVEKINA